MRIDSDLVMSLIGGFAEGLSFIHTSKFRFHGRLRPSCCLVNSRFVLKISELGYGDILRRMVNDQEKIKPDKRYTAPELSTIKGHPAAKAMMKADVFAFGKIVQEFTMEDAMSLTMAKAKSDKQNIPARCKALFESCSETEPERRPSMVFVKNSLRKLQGRRFNNYTRITIMRLEKYTESLEEAVGARTEELKTERAKCESLLREILPEAVVRALRNGVGVEAQQFDDASIYFSSLPGFPEWVQSMPPRAVIVLLSDVYSEFDRKISRFPVQKIETIGDVYMVACGVPSAHSDHALEVCRMASALFKDFDSCIAGNYTNFHLKLRAGINSGSCVAGVIGKKVPRYCLFGDTVNTAARMESSGESGRIQMTSSTVALLRIKNVFQCERRGVIRVKGKGDMETFWLVI
ncbi:atrial natriuretic peptide receptor 2-like [Paramacrobiotus metropolitanus]|uniref:atrial natriuretic peptide receptor 2-like n=1 Tax=Paramacrobiotus metropolitanus TaxID=2943436 RepID=UPI002445B664|nr:atrial natriuretic peptide receptor 2-like [Paramacrobiotus metropolitanus]